MVSCLCQKNAPWDEVVVTLKQMCHAFQKAIFYTVDPLLMDNQLKVKENVEYSYDEERKLKNLKEKQKKLEEENIAFSRTWEIVLRVSQIIVKLYRWLRVYVQEEASWDEAVAALRRLYTTF